MILDIFFLSLFWGKFELIVSNISSSVQENVDSLISCVKQDIGFSDGKPTAAYTIYKCLLHWRSFEAERTSVFDRLIQMIGSAIEVMINAISCKHIHGGFPLLRLTNIFT